MKLAVVFMAVMALATASYYKPSGEVKYFDKDMIYKQQFFLDVLFKVWEPAHHDFIQKMGDKFIWDKTYYSEYDHDMEYFHDLYKSVGFAPRGVVYSVFNKHFLKEVSGLFKFFYFAKDFETFQKNVCWARQYVNEGVFVYALQMFVFHNELYSFVVLPPLYEILPHFFYNGKFIFTTKGFDMEAFKYQEVTEQKYFDHYKHVAPYFKQYIKQFDWYSKKFHYVEDKTILRDEYEMVKEADYKKFFEGCDMFWVSGDYSDKYEIFNEEYKIRYLTEDFDFNMYWYYFNLQYPFWLHGKQFNLHEERRGEYFLYTIQQILARYYSERYSQGLGEIEEFSWYTPYTYGYHPQLVTYGGYAYSYRPNYYEIYNNEEFSAINVALTFERRISNVIARGFYEAADGTKYYLNKPESIEQIGLLLQGSVDSIDRKFFGSWMTLYHTLLSYGSQYDLVSENKFFDNMPHVLSQFETMMRDPLFYSMYKRVYDLFYQFKYYLGEYKKADLYFAGVKIEDVVVDKITTYYGLVDYDVSTLLNKDLFFHEGKFNWKYFAYGRRYVLNNKPYSFTYKFTSDKQQKVVFRTFVAPQYDSYGKEWSINEARPYFYEIDQFVHEAVVGENIFKRESGDFFHAHKDHLTYGELYKFVEAAGEGKYQFPVDYTMNKLGAFPERLFFPRGWKAGLPMKVYVIVTPFDSSIKEYSYEQHHLYFGEDYDFKPYGYPLDRPIDEVYFWQPNMYYGDFHVYHDEEYYKHFPEYSQKYFESYRYYF
ncbi:hypothetical protein ACFFRR_002419 [Megaselia abdita]